MQANPTTAPRSGIVLMAALVLVLAGPAHAYWSQAPTVIFGGPSDEQVVASVGDGDGGLFAAIQRRELVTNRRSIHMFRLSCAGEPLWGPVPFEANGAAIEPLQVLLESDGQGGVIGMARTNASGHLTMFVQHWDRTGSPTWSGSGGVTTGPNDSDGNVRMTADGEGGVFLAWMNHAGGAMAARLQHVDSSGQHQWLPSGLTVPIPGTGLPLPLLAPDGNGGLFVVAESNPVFVEHLDRFGQTMWPAPGTGERPFGVSYIPGIVSHTSGGLWVLGTDQQHSARPLRAWHFDSTGHVDRLARYLSAGYGIAMSLLPDHAGGYIVTWLGDPTGTLRIQHVTAADSAAWSLGGEALEASSSALSARLLVGDYSRLGLAYTTTTPDSRPRVVVRSLGSLAAPDFGAPLLEITRSVAVDTGGFWLDRVIPTCGDTWTAIYGDAQTIDDPPSGYRIDALGQRIDADGRHGVNEPVVLTVRDVPGDTGGFVDVTWRTSDLRLDPAVGGLAYDVLRAPSREGPWDLVATGLEPTGATDSMRIATFADSTSGCDCRTWLRVDARTEDGLFRASRVAVGASIPNVADTTLAGPAPTHAPLFFRVSPTPARGACTVAYALAVASDVRLTLHDAQGRRVRMWKLGLQSAGTHVLPVELRDDGGRTLRPGAWFVRLQAGDQVRVARLVTRD